LLRDELEEEGFSSYKEDVGSSNGKSNEKERDLKWLSNGGSTPLANSAEIPPLINWHPMYHAQKENKLLSASEK